MLGDVFALILAHQRCQFKSYGNHYNRGRLALPELAPPDSIVDEEDHVQSDNASSVRPLLRHRTPIKRLHVIHKRKVLQIRIIRIEIRAENIIHTVEQINLSL